MFDFTRNLLLPLLYLLASIVSAQRPNTPVLPPLPDQVAQLFMVGLPGESDLPTLGAPLFGNYILFADNIGSDQQLQQLTTSLSAAGAVPVWIAVDQEGGAVVRVQSDPTKETGQPLLSDPQPAFAVAQSRARHLRSLGINMVLSPVVDRASDRRAGLRNRSFPQLWGELGAAMVSGYQAGGVTSVVKHFPSYGDLPGDVERSIPRKALTNEEIEIFRIALKDAAVLMVSPVIIENIDPSLPAPLSPKAVEFIRGELGFQGVLLTDDVQMRGVVQEYDPVEFAQRAIESGMDMVMFSSSGESVSRAYQSVLSKAEQDEKFRQLIQTAYERIVRKKITAPGSR